MAGEAAVKRPFGPRTNRVYSALRERILRGELEPGAKLPGYLHLAARFGVAPMTVRQVLGRLEEEGLVVRRLGRGTFVRQTTRPAVLIVTDDPATRAILVEQVEHSGYRAVAAGEPAEGLALLEGDPEVALVLSDLQAPAGPGGVELIQTVRQRRPELPLAAIIAAPDDLAELYGSPEWPVLILAKPLRAGQVAEVLRLALAGG
jgi:DNA-binding transcriptional regulator YhcF (GntR family)